MSKKGPLVLQGSNDMEYWYDMPLWKAGKYKYNRFVDINTGDIGQAWEHEEAYD